MSYLRRLEVDQADKTRFFTRPSPPRFDFSSYSLKAQTSNVIQLIIDRKSAPCAVLGFRPSSTINVVLSSLFDQGVSIEGPISGVPFRTNARSDLPEEIQNAISKILSHAISTSYLDLISFNIGMFILSPVAFLINGPYVSKSIFVPAASAISESSNWLGSGRLTSPLAQVEISDALVAAKTPMLCDDIAAAAKYVLERNLHAPFLCPEAVEKLSQLLQ